MTIYAIYSKAFGDLVEATSNVELADLWASVGYRIDTQEDATDAERAILDRVDQLLRDNYKDGAHWIYETRNNATHLVGLREAGSEAAYCKALKAEWQLIHDHSEEIRAA